MTIDERIEAIAMHLEVLTGMHGALEKRFDELVATHQEFQRRMTQYSADVKDTMARLANIAAAHEERLDDHDTGIADIKQRLGDKPR